MVHSVTSRSFTMAVTTLTAPLKAGEMAWNGAAQLITLTESSGLASVPWQVSASFTLAINVGAREKERVAGYDLTGAWNIGKWRTIILWKHFSPLTILQLNNVPRATSLKHHISGPILFLTSGILAKSVIACVSQLFQLRCGLYRRRSDNS